MFGPLQNLVVHMQIPEIFRAEIAPALRSFVEQWPEEKFVRDRDEIWQDIANIVTMLCEMTWAAKFASHSAATVEMRERTS